MYSKLQDETQIELAKIPANVVSGQAQSVGIEGNEPLIFGLDGMLRYAKAYRKQYDRRLADDGFLGNPWLEIVKGYRALLNGNGVVAMERDRSTDSKDNGACEAIFWRALEAAGFTESDI